MSFVEAPPFLRARERYLDDESFRLLQVRLLMDPRAGAVIPGTNGVRKLRWRTPGTGTRGGLRVIYYVVSSRMHCYLLYAYAKSDQTDLSPDEKRLLAGWVRTIEESI